jgi:TfoX/Sxy family transcriptional regulator of competence genes
VPYDETLAGRLRKALGSRPDVSERKMFGGLAFLCHGRMCCGIIGDDLVVRVMAEDMPQVMKSPHVRPMDFTGRPLKGFVYVAPGGYKTAAALRTWVERALRFVESDEAPIRKTRRRRPGS